MASTPLEIAADGVTGRRLLAWPLFLVLFSFYLLGTGGTIDTPDGVLMFHVTESLVQRQALDIAELPGATGWGGIVIEDPATHRQKFYAKYGLGLSLAAIPAYLAGKVLAPLASEREKDIFQVPGEQRSLWYDTSPQGFRRAFLAFAASWTNSALEAATLLGVFLILVELGFGLRAALGASLLGAVATPLWPYSKTFFSEPLGGLGLVFFFYFALRGRLGPAGEWTWLAAGLSLGVSALAKPACGVLVLPGVILLAGYARHLPARTVAVRWGLFFLGFLALVGLLLAYNHARFGSWWETGYGEEIHHWTTPWLEGVQGLLISPGRGLLLYFPLWLLVVPGLRRLTAGHRLEAVFILGCFLILLGTHALWYRWEGGWCWGPRFLVPVIPILVIPLGAWLASPPHGKLPRTLAVLVMAVAVAVSFSGAWVNFNDYHHWLHERFEGQRALFQAQGYASSTELYRWSWRNSPLWGYWSFPDKDYFLFPRATRRPGLILVLFLSGAGLLLGQLYLLFSRLARSRRVTE